MADDSDDEPVNTEAILKGIDAEESSKSSKGRSSKHQNSAGHSDSMNSHNQVQADKSGRPPTHKDDSRSGQPSNIEAAFGRNRQDIPYNLGPKRHQQDSKNYQRGNGQYQSHRKSELDFSRPAESRQEDAPSKDFEPKNSSKRSEPNSQGGNLSDNARQRDSGNQPGWSTEDIDWHSKPRQNPRQHNRGGYQNQRGVRGRARDNYDSRRDDYRDGPSHRNQDQQRTQSNQYYQKQPNNHQNHNRNQNSNRGDLRYQRASYRPANDRMQHYDNNRQKEPQGLIDENASRKGETRSVYETLRHTATLEEYLSGLSPDPGSESLDKERNCGLM